MKLVGSSAGETISDDTATRDLRAMTKAGLLKPVGEKRGRRYEPTPQLHRVWLDIRQQRPARLVDDPYVRSQPTLPGLDVAS